MLLRVCYVLLLGYCVVVQHNDVDALLWMVLYGAAVVTAVLPRSVPQLAVVVCALLGIGWLGLPVNEEEWRELGGLLLVAIGHALLWRQARSSEEAVSA